MTDHALGLESEVLSEGLGSELNKSKAFAYQRVVEDICKLRWVTLTQDDMISVAWVYYYFSVQFRESLEIARNLYPDDDRLRNLDQGECDTDNLSPWPGVASVGERMNHDEYMRRALALLPHTAALAPSFERIGKRYLAVTRCQPSLVRVAALASYEDGGLERVFTAMLTFAHWDNAVLM